MNTETPHITIPESAKAISSVKEAVAHEFGVSVADLESTVRREPLPMIRHLAMALCYDLIENVTLANIAEAFNRLQHQSVLHGIGATKTRCQQSKGFAARVAKLTTGLRATIAKG